MDKQILESFYSDSYSLGKALRFTDAAYLSNACGFIRELRRIGIEHSHIHVSDFDVFAHKSLAGIVERFIAANPFDALPLEKITIVQIASRDTCGEDLDRAAASLRANAERLRHFATRYSIDIDVQIHLQWMNAPKAAAVAAFAVSEAVDRIGFVLDLPSLDASSAAALRESIACFCDYPVSGNTKVRLGNFPFCFFPPGRFAIAYRDAVEPLKGQIGAQRGLIRDLRGRDFRYHAPCRACRCRRACYAYTDIEDHSSCAACLTPKQGSTLVFAGGSISPGDVTADDDRVWTGPAEQGDMLAAVLEGFETLLIIDGYFYNKFPCTTFEVMLALEAGVNVFGSSSIGALRAVELDRYGMHGVGCVYESLKRRDIKPYPIVAQTYDEQDRPLTAPLVQILYFLERARAEGVITSDEQVACGTVAEGIHFTLLSFEHVFRLLHAADGTSRRVAADLEAYYTAKGAACFDIKRQDALLLLARYKAVLSGRGRDHVTRVFKTARERSLGLLYGKYRRDHDLALPAGWRTPAVADGVVREHRECPAELTCERARRFFSDLDLVVADTTRFDPSGSHVLSVFLVPFYFLDYYPSSATGNGAVFEGALAAACMELVERAPACALHIAGAPRDALETEPFPLERIPQFYNRGDFPAAAPEARDAYGYVRVSEIVSGREVFIPKAAVMFGFSGTDGNAAGNSLREAVLYGIYELVERDTCQMHLVDPALRKRQADFRVHPGRVADAPCQALLAQAEQKGCRMVLFELPNLYGLSCVMCHVYDRNRAVQCHGGIAVRAHFAEAARAALHEATMQYITYFAGTRDDYRAFASGKQARAAYAHAQRMFFDTPAARPEAPPAPVFASVGAELDYVIGKLTSADVSHILVADLSPREARGVKSVKVIIPGLELWFCPAYRPSPFLKKRLAKLKGTLKS